MASFAACHFVFRKFWRQQVPKLRALLGPNTSEKKRPPYSRGSGEAKTSAAGPVNVL